MPFFGRRTPALGRQQRGGFQNPLMAKSQIYPAVCDYLSKVSSEVIAAKEAGLDVDFLVDDANALAKLVKTMKEQMTTLETNIAAAQASEEEIFEQAVAWRDDVFAMMQALRETVDQSNMTGMVCSCTGVIS